MIVGANHFRTFDGRHFDFAGNSTYLVARDFVHDHFAILLKYDTTRLIHKIIILVGKHAIEVNVFQDVSSCSFGYPRTRVSKEIYAAVVDQSSWLVWLQSVQLLGEGQAPQLPLELDEGRVFVYQEESIVTVERADKQFKLECNLKYELCRLELAGWYYGKTAGLLGTMSNEQWDDLLSSNGHLDDDIERFARSWALTQDNDDNLTKTKPTIFTEISPKASLKSQGPFCQQLFANKSSEFSSCFSFVDPQPFDQMCTTSTSLQEVCAIAVGYLQSCTFYDTYLRIPDACTSCAIETGNGNVPEGDFRKLEGIYWTTNASWLKSETWV